MQSTFKDPLLGILSPKPHVNFGLKHPDGSSLYEAAWKDDVRHLIKTGFAKGTWVLLKPWKPGQDRRQRCNFWNLEVQVHSRYQFAHENRWLCFLTTVGTLLLTVNDTFSFIVIPLSSPIHWTIPVFSSFTRRIRYKLKTLHSLRVQMSPTYKAQLLPRLLWEKRVGFPIWMATLNSHHLHPCSPQKKLSKAVVWIPEFQNFMKELLLLVKHLCLIRCKISEKGRTL